MIKYRFSLNISADDWQIFYQGGIRSIVVRAFNGLKLSIPARNFIPYVGFSGIHGTFEITFNAQRKIIHLKKI